MRMLTQTESKLAELSVTAELLLKKHNELIESASRRKESLQHCPEFTDLQLNAIFLAENNARMSVLLYFKTL